MSLFIAIPTIGALIDLLFIRVSCVQSRICISYNGIYAHTPLAPDGTVTLATAPFEPGNNQSNLSPAEAPSGTMASTTAT